MHRFVVRSAPSRRLLVALLAAMASLLMAGAVSVSAAAPAHAYAHDSRERRLVGWVNKERARAHLRPLAARSDLQTVAQRWAGRMAAANRLSHNPRLTRQVHSYRWVGENVGYGPQLGTVHAALMRSPGHRANVLNRAYTQVGVAVVVRGGRVWVVEVFRRPA